MITNSPIKYALIILMSVICVACAPKNLREYYISEDSAIFVKNVELIGENIHMFLSLDRTKTVTDILGHNNTDTVLKSEIFLAIVPIKVLIEQKKKVIFEKVAESKSRTGYPFLVNNNEKQIYVLYNHYGECVDYVNECSEFDLKWEDDNFERIKNRDIYSFLYKGESISLNYITYLRLEYLDENPVRKIKINFKLSRKNWIPFSVRLVTIVQ